MVAHHRYSSGDFLRCIELAMFDAPVLSFQLPTGESKEIKLSQDSEVLIGRNRACTIKLNLPSVSRQHAKIVFEGGSFWLSDLGSSNGTHLNQEPIRRARITIGDVIHCGEFMIRVLSIQESQQNHAAEQEALKSMKSLDFPFGANGSENQELKKTQAPPPPFKPSLPSRSINPLTKALSQSDSMTPDKANLSDSSNRDAIQKFNELELALADQKSKAERERQNLHSQLEAQTAIADQLRIEVNELQRVAQGSQEQVSRLETRLRERDYESEKEALKQSDQSKELREDNQRLRQQIRIQQEQREDEIAELNKALEKATKAHEPLINELEQLKIQHEQMTSDSQALSTEVSNLTEQLKDRSDRCEDLLSDLNIVSDTLDRTKAQLRTLEDKHQDETAHLQEKVESLRDQLDEAMSAKITSTNESGPLKYNKSELPRPNIAATDPDWARHQARLEHYTQEIRSLKRAAKDREGQNIQSSLSTQDLFRYLKKLLSEHTSLQNDPAKLEMCYSAVDQLGQLLNENTPRASERSAETDQTSKFKQSTKDDTHQEWRGIF